MFRFFSLFIFLFTSILWSQPHELEKYFNATKSEDFQLAFSIAYNQNDPVWENHLVLLTELLSQKLSHSSFNQNLELHDDLNLNFIKYLIAGYQNVYAIKQNDLQAFKQFSQALKLAEELENMVMIKATLFGILDLFASEIFLGSKQFEPYLERLIEIKSDMIDEAAIIFYKLIFYSKAEGNMEVLDTQYYTYYSKLDSIFQKIPKSHKLWRKYYFEKAIYHKIEGNYQRAEDFLLKADSVVSINKYLKNFKSDIAWHISQLKMMNNQMSDSKLFLELAKNTSTKLRDTFYNDRLASLIFQKEGNYDSAYHYLRKSVDIEYELGYKNNTLESSILTVQNQTDKLKLDKLELESSNNRFRNWAILLGMLFILGSVIGVLAQKNTKRKQLLAEQEKNLEQEKVSNLIKEQELVAIDAMIEGQEKERQRVANELHDDLGSLMAAVKLQFNSLEAADKKGNLETFAITESLIDEAYGKIRAIAHAKNSGLIAKQGLLQAVKQMAEKVSIASGISILVHDHGLDTRLENTMELMLFRIIQELMTNVIKHAAASEMNVHITNHGDTLNILVEDNGKGMALGENRVDNTGMGLKSIDKRIDNLHGTMDIESELGKGTVIILDIPI